MAMLDDEFGDEIDWSAVQLPSVSAPAAAAPGGAGNATNGPPPSTTGGPPLARHSWGGGAPAPSPHHQSAGIPQQGHNTGGYGQNFAAAGAAPPIHNNFAPSNNDTDALRRQIESLQNQLQSKDDQIFELEATAAASAAESAHRTQRAESEAREKVRLAQEEARRAMAEADRNRGGMIRYKKRAAELEAQKQANEGDRDQPNGQGNLGAWGPPVADVEMRKVTPVTFEESPAKGGDIDTSPAQSGGSKKRKARQAINIDAADVPSYLPRQFGGVRNALAIGGNSTRQRLARHLLEREEMGCYGGMVGIESTATMDVDSVGTEKQQLSRALRQDIRIDGETRAFVRSVIFQMAEAPCATGNLSSSGLVQVLLTKFHSLFHCVGDKNAVTVDGDGDHVMGGDSEENGENRNEPSIEDGNQCYQRMALALLKTEEGESSCLPHKTVSWRAALRLLRVVHDILLLSGNAREDLRWWFYQSRQSAGGRAIGDGNSPPKAVGGASQDDDGNALARIEGLPTSFSRGRTNADREEVLWTPGCRPGPGQPNAWDPVTMARPLNALFDLLVGIMQGNTFDCSSDDTKDATSNTAPEEIIVRSVQLKAIDVILALMLDAPPYDQAKDGALEAPYLWKFWFDSLLPSHPDVQIGAPFEVGDLLSVWEKSSSGNEGQQEQLVIVIKSRILRLLSHFMQSSSSVHQSLRQNANEKEKKSITKRIISAILGDLEDCVVPFLTFGGSTQDAAQHLELCHSCLHFLLILSRSNEGIRVLRLQMRLESEDGKQSRWSQSAIGLTALVLDGTLSFATKRETAALQSAHLADPLNAIVKQCVSFFKNLLLFVDQQRKSSSKPVTFSSLASEHSTVFQSSLEQVLAHQSPSRATDSPRLLRCSEGKKRDVQELLAEIAEDRKDG